MTVNLKKSSVLEVRALTNLWYQQSLEVVKRHELRGAINCRQEENALLDASWTQCYLGHASRGNKAQVIKGSLFVHTPNQKFIS